MSEPIEMQITGTQAEVPMRVGGTPDHYVTETELMEILAAYVTKTDLQNEPTIVRWQREEQ